MEKSQYIAHGIVGREGARQQIEALAKDFRWPACIRRLSFSRTWPYTADYILVSTRKQIIVQRGIDRSIPVFFR